MCVSNHQVKIVEHTIDREDNEANEFQVQDQMSEANSIPNL